MDKKLKILIWFNILNQLNLFSDNIKAQLGVISIDYINNFKELLSTLLQFKF